MTWFSLLQFGASVDHLISSLSRRNEISHQFVAEYSSPAHDFSPALTGTGANLQMVASFPPELPLTIMMATVR